jgi:hypothetical protein
MQCPYYRKSNVENYPHGFKEYCAGDRRIGLRVPSLFEQTHYYTTHQYAACRVFQERQGASEDEDGPETASGQG